MHCSVYKLLEDEAAAHARRDSSSVEAPTGLGWRLPDRNITLLYP